MENFGLYDDPTQQAIDERDEYSDEAQGLDLGQLDEKSVKIMVMLMLFLLENEMTTVDFFAPVLRQQRVMMDGKPA